MPDVILYRSRQADGASHRMSSIANRTPRRSASVARGGGRLSRVAAAEKLCAGRGRRLTALRRRVLEIVLDAGQPVGAYEILDRLRAQTGRGAPPSVYRALEFLTEQGLVHRVVSLNAFVGCTQPHEDHRGQFLICTGCGAVTELEDPAIDDTIRERARAAGFDTNASVVEATGRCARCHD